MVALYITSTESKGKTTFCAGISKKLLDRGAKIGFMMPVHVTEAGGSNGCADATFMKDIMKLPESEELICPIRLSANELWKNLAEDTTKFVQNLKQAYSKIEQGKDIVVLEGPGNLNIDKVSNLACYTIADGLEARVIIVLDYSPNLDVSKIEKIRTKLKHLIGVVVNFVPKSKIQKIRPQLIDSFSKAGIKVLGVLPEVRSLLGVTVAELARALDGEILVCQEKADELVENVMLGAMTVDSGVNYFSRKDNKAVLVRGERADMQLAALQTSTKCLIVTDNIRPLPFVMVQAQEKQVPVIMVKQDTASAIAGIEKTLAESSFRSPRKLEIFDMVLDSYFDLEAFYAGLGLKG